ncbi:MAG TPA: Uma2 family endonuclease [Pyrinomonadaceae bacterium]|jgi:Uma2 family endonuclease|nr:Uma2 family endonuclease [Pyrinomonadaceae bacterium]
MITKLKPLTIADWDAIPYKEGYRYEIIEGELFVSRSPGLTHQVVLGNLIFLFQKFLESSRIGVAVMNPGLILSNYSGVIPDLVFFLNNQRDTIVTNDRLTGPPALVVEIVSPGSSNIRRDRVAKLQLYAKHDVPEYWIVDPKNSTVERYVNQGSSLILQETLGEEETLTTPALSGFSCRVSDIFSHF